MRIGDQNFESLARVALLSNRGQAIFQNGRRIEGGHDETDFGVLAGSHEGNVGANCKRDK